jgi:hypothetical protein
LGALGWGSAGYVTARAVAGGAGISLRIIGWGLAYLASLLLGLYWLFHFKVHYFGPITAIGVAGAIGGLFSSPRIGVWRLVASAIMGITFFLLAAISFYASYFLSYAFTPLSRLFGNLGANAFIWGFPGAACGFICGFLARRILPASADL